MSEQLGTIGAGKLRNSQPPRGDDKEYHVMDSVHHCDHTGERNQNHAGCASRHHAGPGSCVRLCRQFASSSRADQQHSAGDRQECETEKLDRSIGRIDADAKHQQRIDEHCQCCSAPGESSALRLKTGITHALYWRSRTTAAAADSASMQIAKPGKSLEYGNGRECLIAISLDLHRW